MVSKPICGELEHRLHNLQHGDHLCCIYETEDEHRALLTPFMLQGLERREKVIYIVDAQTGEQVGNYLRDDGVEVKPYLDSGQLTILEADKTYIKKGGFDPEEMITRLRGETECALAEGYSALRVTGEMSWASKGLLGSERLIEYEASLNRFFFPNNKCLAVCQYNRRLFDSTRLLNVMFNHNITVIGTEVYDNFLDAAKALSKISSNLGGYIDVASARKQEHPIQNTKSKETILLVDDDEVVSTMGQQLLKTLGYQVLVANSGKESIEVYEENKGSIDIVVLDMIMPGMGGGETYDQLKELNPNIKVLLSSGYNINGEATEILERGCDGFIQKPYDPAQLFQKIREILDRE